MKWLALLLLVPSAAALEALPQASWGEFDSIIVIRASDIVHVDASRVIQLFDGTTPMDVDPSNASWHGLKGAMELKLHRASTEAVEVRVTQGETGFLFEWPAAKRLPAPGLPAAIAAGLLAAGFLRQAAKTRQAR